jgi:hypothetical protein
MICQIHPPKWAASVLMVISIASCVDRYSPRIDSSDLSILVVNGYLDVGKGTATIQLSRSINLTDSTYAPPPELNAVVTINADDGAVYRLLDIGRGTYRADNLLVNAQKKYSLKIVTQNGQQFASSAVEVKEAPPIDTVSWKVDDLNQGIAISVTTRDLKNNTRYYQWDFQETWAYRTKFISNLEYVNDKIVGRKKDISICYISAKSQSIIIGNSTKLAQDVIDDFRLTLIPQQSIKLTRRYSILVRQYALTQSAYEYWSGLKKNNESLGNLFAPLPSRLAGNISNVNNPSAPVIGFFSAHSVTEKRIFIDNFSLPPFRTQTGYEQCVIDTVKLSKLPAPDEIPSFSRAYLLIDSVSTTAFGPPRRILIGYSRTTVECADCRCKGGSIDKPTFWK